MNLKNLVMWVVIVFLTIGLYNMFKNPQQNLGKKNNIIFSEFLSEVDNGRVVRVEIQGNNIKGVFCIIILNLNVSWPPSTSMHDRHNFAKTKPSI